MTSLSESVSVLSGRDSWHTPAAAGIPEIRMSDGPAGVRGTSWTGPRSAVFPCGSALGATFDPTLIQEVGVALGSQARSKSAHVLLAPTVNLHRTPIGGRNFECMSEDPLLTGVLARAYVEGVQSQGIACCIKHFIGNDTEHERSTISSEIDERTLREVYLLPFEMAVERNVRAVMTAYNKLNGTVCADHDWLITTVLRNEWGFDGVVISDWFGLHSTAEAMNAGLDIEMPGPTRHRGLLLESAVNEGAVDSATIEASVARVRALAEWVQASKSDGSERTDDDALTRDVQYRTAVGSTVLLTNDNDQLPWPAQSVDRIALIGPYASTGRPQGGGSAKVRPSWVASLLESLNSRDHRVDWAQGCSISRFHPSVRGEFTLDVVDEHGVSVSLTKTSLDAFWQDGPTDEMSMTFGATMSGTFTPKTSGQWSLGCRSVGECRIAIDGKEVLAISTGDAGGSMFGHGSPERSVDIELVAGRSVEITIDYPIDDHPGIRGFMVGLQEPQHTDLFAEAVELAAASDRALVVVGTDDDWETESEDRTTMQLPGRQDDLISAIAAVNPNTVVVVNAGSPVTMPWRDEVAAILYIWFPGGALGDALCDVVFGETDPGGRLPLTFPVSLSDTPAAPHYPGVDGVMRYGEGRQIGHRWYRATSTPPQFWFGHGLSYTSFEVGDVSVTGDLRDGVTVAMSITNVGSRVGVHVAQLFTSFDGDHPEMSDDVRFVGSIKVELAPHETRRVSIELDARRFSSWLSDRWEIPRGDHVIELGRSAGDVVEIGRLTI